MAKDNPSVGIETVDQSQGIQFIVSGEALRAIGEVALQLDTSYEEAIRHSLGVGLFLAREPKSTQILIRGRDGRLSELIRD